jgi:hypothetical protein
MLDAGHEIDRLRQVLRMKNLSESLVDNICDEVSRDIGMIAADIVAAAMSEAVAAGSESGSVDFINEIKAQRAGSFFEITTTSGKLDFSEPPFPMLPKLLKNAKVAKDGSTYKVIPLKKKSSSNRLPVTTEAAIQNINNARHIAREEQDAARESQLRQITSPDPLRGLDAFASMQSTRISKQQQVSGGQNIGNVDLRTASSKQDPQKQWVNPGRSADMTSHVRQINANMQDQIDQAIIEIIKRYEGMF